MTFGIFLFWNVIKSLHGDFILCVSLCLSVPFFSFSLICFAQAWDPGMGLENAGWGQSWGCGVCGGRGVPLAVAPLFPCPHLRLGSCFFTRLTSAVWQSSMSQKCFENSQGVLWISRTHSGELDLNDQKQGFAGHTFPHMKGRIHTSLDTSLFLLPAWRTNKMALVPSSPCLDQAFHPGFKQGSQRDPKCLHFVDVTCYEEVLPLACKDMLPPLCNASERLFLSWVSSQLSSTEGQVCFCSLTEIY